MDKALTRWLWIFVLLLTATLGRAQFTHTWDFTNPLDYTVSDPQLIEVDSAAPGHAQLILQARQIQHVATNDYFGTNSFMSGLTYGTPAYVTLRRLAGEYAEQGAYTSRIIEGPSGSRWRYMRFSSANDQHMADPSLLAWYRMDNDGWLNYASGVRATANNMEFTTDAKAGGFAGNFRGNAYQGYLQHPDRWMLNNRTAITIAFWIKLRSYTDIGRVFSSYWTGHDVNVGEWLYRSGSYNKQWYFQVGSMSMATPLNAAVLDEWQFLVVTWDKNADGKGRIYIDGDLSTASGNSFSQTLNNAGDTPRIGGETHLSRFTDGIIDEFAVWNRALTPDEIARLYKGYYDLYPLRFQVRSGSSPAEVETRDFVGDDGTPDTYYLARNASLATSDNLIDTDRYIQYRALMRSSEDHTQAPLVGAVGLYGTLGMVIDDRTSDFDLGNYGANTVREGVGRAGMSYLGLGRSRAGGYQPQGTFVSRVFSNADGPTTWDELEWLAAGEAVDADQAADLIPGLLGYYRGGSTWLDSALKGRSGSPSGGVGATDIAKLGNQSATFNGIDGYVDGFGYGTATVHTLEFWVKTPEANTPLMTFQTVGANTALVIENRTLMATGFAPAHYPQIYVNGNPQSPRLHNGWNHVALVWPLGTTIPQWTVGRVGGNYFRGMLDDVAVYATIRGPAAIMERYLRGGPEIGGRLRFQARASNDPEFGGVSFVGPGNNPGQYFVSSPASLPALSGQYFQYRVVLEGGGEMTPGLISSRVHYGSFAGSYADEEADDFYAGSLREEWSNPVWYGQALRLPELWTLAPPNATPGHFSSVLSSVWHMDGAWEDSVGGANGTPVGGPGFSSDAKVGSRAGTFNGVDSRIGLANPALGDAPFSFGVWFRSGTTNRSGIASTFTGGQTQFFRLELNDDGQNNRTEGSVTLVITDGTTTHRLPTQRRYLNDSRWHHALIVRNADQVLLYIDGVLEAARHVGVGFNEIDQTSITLAYSAATGFLPGALDEAALFNGALTPGEIGRLVGAGYVSQARAADIGVLRGARENNQEPGIWETLGWSPDGMYGARVPGSRADVIGQWSFEETTGQALDSSGNGNHATVAGGLLDQPGRIGRAVSLDGSGGITVNGTTGLSPAGSVAVSAWVKPDSTPNQAIFSKQSGASGYALSLDGDGRPRFQVNSLTVSAPLPLRAGVWQHVHGQLNAGGETLLFVNGEMAARATLGVSLAHGGTAYIGRSAAGDEFAGSIDEVTVFNRALTPIEIQDHYRAGAATLHFQVETESPAPASGFIGPDGTTDSVFTDWFGADMSANVPLGRYFQYETTLATEDFRHGPVLRGVRLDVSSYPSTAPYVNPVVAAAREFPGRLLSFSHQIVQGERTDVRYQLTGDSGPSPTWYYYDTAAETWIAATGLFGYEQETSSPADVQAGFGHFYDQHYDKTGGDLRFRAFLESEGDHPIRLREVVFSGTPGRLTLTFPNGEEVGPLALVVGVPYEITWESEGTVSDNLTIELYNNGGATFDRTLATGVGDTGVYRTVITEDVRDDYRIKITDADRPASIYDWSDGNFELVQDLRLTQPNGGDHWYAGQTNRVLWDSWGVGGAELGDRVSLWFSNNGGSNWFEITPPTGRPANQVGNNVYDWLTPLDQANVISEWARMGVSTPGALSPVVAAFGDTSVSNFTMAGVAVTFPTAGTGIKMDSEVGIAFTAAGAGAGGVQIELFNGVNWTNLASAAPVVAGTNVFHAVLSAPNPTEDARIRITANDDSLVTGITPTFVLADINIINPRGGTPAERERWRINSDQTIRWTSGGAGDTVDIHYSTDGTNWTQIHTGYANTNSSELLGIVTNMAPWTVQGPPSGNARMRIRSMDQPDLFAVTQPFDITGVQVVSPNGFETWEFTEANDVEWLHRSTAGQIDMYITYSDGPTNAYEVLQEGVSIFDGRWTIQPERVRRPTTMGRLLLRARGNPLEFDLSDDLFTIRGMSMTHPTNQAVYNLRSTRTQGLQWFSARTEDTTAELYYAHDGVNFDRVIYFSGLPFIGNVDAGTSLNRHDWQIPGNLMPSTAARVKVVAGAYEAISPAFTLRGIRVTRPVAGDRLDVGGAEGVQWEMAGLASSAWSSNALSVNGMAGPFMYVGVGADDTDEAFVLNRGFLWNVHPDLDPTTNAVIRMSVYTPAHDTDVVMYSDPFTLRGLKVNQPDAAAVWTLGDQRQIDFRAAGLGAGAQAVLRYSHDGGQTFDTQRLIAENVNVADGLNSRIWDIEASPAWTRMPSTNAVIQIVSGAHEARSEPFRMRGIKVTRPVGSDIWAVSDLTNTIQWAAVDGAGTYTLSFTRWDGGAPVYTETIATGVTGSEYDWTMPASAVGENITLSVTDGTLSGVSEWFEIVTEPSIRIIQPAAGDFWKVNSAQTIVWSRGGNMINDFTVDYSAYPYQVTNRLAQGAFDLEAGMFSAVWDPIPNAVGPMRLIIVNQVDDSIQDTFDTFEVAAKFEIDPFVGDVFALEPNPVDWTTRGSLSSGVDFYYSTDLLRAPDSWVKVNDTPFTQIAHNQPSTYLWTVANVKTDTVWFRIQDANYSQRFPATAPGPFDDLGPFEVKYYQITWNVRDAATSNHLDQLSVSDSSGWSESGLGSPVMHEYPYGTWDTVWFREFFADKVVFQWHSRPSREIDVFLDKSEIEPDFRVMANFAYNNFMGVFNIQSWLERGGRIIGTPQQNTVRIYDAAGNLIDTLTSSTPSDGVFWQTWDVEAAEAALGRTFSNMEVFFARVEVVYSGVTYSSGLTFMLRQAADVGDIPQDFRVHADFNYRTSQTNFVIQTWLEERGLILDDASGVTVEVFESGGAPVTTLTQNTPVNGVFWLNWSLAGLGYTPNDNFFAKVTIDHDGNSYSAGFTLQPRQAASEEIETVIDSIGESTSTILGGLDQLSGDMMAQFTNVTDSIEGARLDILSSVGTNRLMLDDVITGIAGIDADLAVILPDVTNMAARLPGIEDDLTAGLARILTRPTTLEFGSTNTILYRSRPGYGGGVTLTIEPGGGSRAMNEVVPGIYQAAGVIAEWGLGEFLWIVTDPNASDRTSVRVVRPGMDQLPGLLAGVSNDLQRLEADVGALNAMMLDLPTLTDMTNEIDRIVTDIDALRAVLDEVAMADDMQAAMADLARGDTLMTLSNMVAGLQTSIGDVDLTELARGDELAALSNLVADVRASIGDLDLSVLPSGEELMALSNLVAGIEDSLEDFDLSELARETDITALSNLVSGVSQAIDDLDLSALPSGDELVALSNLVANIRDSLDDFDMTELARGDAVSDLHALLDDVERSLTAKAEADQVESVRQAVEALDVQIDTGDLSDSVRTIRQRLDAMGDGVDPETLSSLQGSVERMAASAPGDALMPRLDAMASRLAEVGADAEDAFKRASSARTEASRAASGVDDLRDELEAVNLPGMVGLLDMIEEALRNAQQDIAAIPDSIEVQPHVESLNAMAQTIERMARSQGFEQWLEGTPDEPGVAGETEPETLSGLNRRMEEMQGEMQLLYRLMEDIVHEPIIEETLLGVE